MIRWPYDPEARSGQKRETVWLGYKVHLTETCQTPQVEAAEGQDSRATPQLIVQIETTLADVQDVQVTADIQQALAQAELVPDEQIVDSGYVDAELLVSSHRDYGIHLLGTARTIVGAVACPRPAGSSTTNAMPACPRPCHYECLSVRSTYLPNFFSRSISRSSTRRILPEIVLGKLSTNSISRGYL